MLLCTGSDVSSAPRIPDGVPPRFPKKPMIRQEGDNLIMECLLEAHPLPDITWFKGDKSIKENKRMRYECAAVQRNKYILTLTIKNPSLADGGLYRCNAVNQFGDSNANIDLNFESGGDDEADASQPPVEESTPTGIAPRFTEKPCIIPNQTGTVVYMKFKVRKIT